MAKSGTWGDHITLIAMVEFLNVGIRLVLLCFVVFCVYNVLYNIMKIGRNIVIKWPNLVLGETILL